MNNFFDWLSEYALTKSGEKTFRSRKGAEEAAKEKGKGLSVGKDECPNCDEAPCACGTVPKSLVREGLA